MLKINYPNNQEILDKLHADYIAIFSLHNNDIRNRYNRFRNILVNPLIPANIEDLLLSNFDDIANYCFNQSELNKWYVRKWLKSLFKYTDFQSKISDFFFSNKEIINLSTCYYCNIDYINTFRDFGDFRNGLDLLKRGDKSDFLKIKNIGPVNAEKIDSIPNRNLIDDINSIKFLKKNQKESLGSLELKENFNHFTLDHVLDQANHPLVALSLYNYVPSCYCCNLKFKHKNAIVTSIADSFLSPSNENNRFIKDVTLKLLFPFEANNHLEVNNLEDFIMDFEFSNNAKEYTRYFDVFKLKGRYVFHKDIALKLIMSAREYPDSQVEEFSKMINKPIELVKYDIFGHELFVGNLEDKPLTKFKRDIAKSIGL